MYFTAKLVLTFSNISGQSKNLRLLLFFYLQSESQLMSKFMLINFTPSIESVALCIKWSVEREAKSGAFYTKCFLHYLSSIVKNEHKPSFLRVMLRNSNAITVGITILIKRKQNKRTTNTNFSGNPPMNWGEDHGDPIENFHYINKEITTLFPHHTKKIIREIFQVHYPMRKIGFIIPSQSQN